MTELVGYELSAGVATLTMDNPPVNALGQGLRAALAGAFARAVADPEARVVVLAAAGRSWPVGADIREFGKPPVPPTLPELCHRIAAAGKPVIAAMSGAALGGGLELALAASQRLAAQGTKLGLPEVNLGILPGAGGTQRLPRLIGAAPALEMILSGHAVSAGKALALGLVDKIAEGDVVAAAQAMARDHIVGLRVLPVASARPRPGMADSAAYLAAVAAARLRTHPPHDRAAPRIVDCVEAALLLPPDEGFTFERTAFVDLADTAEARALRHAFLAERRATRSLPAAEARGNIGRVAVLGGGAIGAGLATELLAAGLAVMLIEAAEAPLQLALGRVARAQEAAVKRGDLSGEKRLADWQRLRASQTLGDAAGADLVIDALPAALDTRSQLLARVGVSLPGHVPILSVTCDTDPVLLAGAAGRGDAHLSLYLTEPVRQVTLVEVAAAAEPAPVAVAAIQALAKLLGWRLLRQGPVPGFLGQRLWTTFGDAADRCLAAGAAPHEVDRALRSYGFALGPYEKRDIYGLDHVLCSHPVRREGISAAPIGLALAEWLMGQGRMGLRGGRGYHHYDEGQRQPQGDPEVIAAVGRFRPRLKLMAADIERRVLAALSNDGAWALAEGRARRPSDVDLVAIAQGFPRWRGGPMQAADEAGLLMLRNDLMAWAADGDGFWQPAPLWDELIRNGRHFGDLNGE